MGSKEGGQRETEGSNLVSIALGRNNKQGGDTSGRDQVAWSATRLLAAAELLLENGGSRGPTGGVRSRGPTGGVVQPPALGAFYKKPHARGRGSSYATLLRWFPTSFDFGIAFRGQCKAPITTTLNETCTQLDFEPDYNQF